MFGIGVLSLYFYYDTIPATVATADRPFSKLIEENLLLAITQHRLSNICKYVIMTRQKLLKLNNIWYSQSSKAKILN